MILQLSVVAAPSIAVARSAVAPHRHDDLPTWERKTDPLLPSRQFLLRVGRSLGAATLILLLSLAGGTVGYRMTAGLPWIDALLNASMILTGMGPVSPMTTTGAKLFASAYALFSGVAFLATMGIVIAPIAHRALHKLHIDDAD